MFKALVIKWLKNWNSREQNRTRTLRLYLHLLDRSIQIDIVVNYKLDCAWALVLTAQSIYLFHTDQFNLNLVLLCWTYKYRNNKPD